MMCMGVERAASHFLAIDFLAGIATSCLLIRACCEPANPIGRLLALRPIVWVGTFSYSLYLIHAPLLQVIWQYMIHPLGLGSGATFGLLAAAAGPLIIGIAYLFHVGCERPFMNTPPKVRSPV
jgi:peptidoglycan/LPS O-acetylase OafA/YrhL